MQETSHGLTPLEQRQINLETESLSLGAKRYHDTIMKARQNHQDMTQFDPEQRLLRKMIEPTVLSIKKMLMTGRGPARYLQAKALLKEVDPYELAFLAARYAVSTTTNPMPLQRACIILGESVAAHIEWRRFHEIAPGYAFKVEANLKTAHTAHRHKVIQHARHKLGLTDLDWSTEQQLTTGKMLLECLIMATGLFMIKDRGQGPRGRGKFKVLMTTPELEQHLRDAHDAIAWLSPVKQPMLCRPVQWTKPVGGGYLSKHRIFQLAVARTRKGQVKKVIAKADMSKVYAALNSAQNTPWCINKQVLRVIGALEGTPVGGLPGGDLKIKLPPKPWGEIKDKAFRAFQKDNPEAVESWKAETSKVYDTHHRETSKRMALRMKVWVARKFQDEAAFYFPHNCDWRGRIYPLGTHLQPQGDDVAKALLLFADGMPLGSDGAHWLAVHGANCAGVDKVSFNDRASWVKEHEDQIVECAGNPLDGSRWWTEADDPFKFLAFCFEWADYIKSGRSSAFVSHIPCYMDGTCNGLQNFSAMLRDEVGGASVNLTPHEKPADIYMQVAAVVIKTVEHDAVHGKVVIKPKRGKLVKGGAELPTEEIIDTKALAKAWLGKIDRGIVKRPVMTLPYGAKLFGFSEQIQEELRKRDAKNPKAPYLNGADNFQQAIYLARVVNDAIAKVVVKAVEAMTWLQHISKIVTAAGSPITWTTPTGFQALQIYHKYDSKRIETYWGGTKITLNIAQDSEKVDTTGMVNGVSPNFVHSMDASHLMLTVNKCVEHGISAFALIHDSYGTHAGNTTLLHKCLRVAFVGMYSGNILQDFSNQMAGVVGPEVAATFPPVPEMGALDIHSVTRSPYFFA